jgi:hypothetical protein
LQTNPYLRKAVIKSEQSQSDSSTSFIRQVGFLFRLLFKLLNPEKDEFFCFPTQQGSNDSNYSAQQESVDNSFDDNDKETNTNSQQKQRFTQDAKEKLEQCRVKTSSFPRAIDTLPRLE